MIRDDSSLIDTRHTTHTHGLSSSGWHCPSLLGPLGPYANRRVRSNGLCTRGTSDWHMAVTPDTDPLIPLRRDVSAASRYRWKPSTIRRGPHEPTHVSCARIHTRIHTHTRCSLQSSHHQYAERRGAHVSLSIMISSHSLSGRPYRPVLVHATTPWPVWWEGESGPF